MINNSFGCKIRVTHFVLTVVFTFSLSSNSFGQSGKHVVLISIDGMRPEFYLSANWPTPNLQQLSKQGIYARHMKSVFPSFTYPSHVAMLTGALPARAGIYYNTQMNSDVWNWFTWAIKVPTLWQALKKNGLTTAGVEWPVSVDSNITWNIPEIWDNDHPEDRITEVRKYATKGLIEEIEVNATGKMNSTNMNEEFFSMDANSARMASYIFKIYRPNLLAIHFASVDGKEHEFGRHGSEVRLAVAVIDRAIGDLLETIERSGLKDSTTVIIVGDHGFADIHQVVRPNVWLKQNGINARFQPAGGSAFLYSANSYETAKVKKALNDLPKMYKKLFGVFDRKKLDEMGVDSNATLALSAVPGIIFSGSTTGDQITPVTGGHHGYDPNLPEMYTGFIAAGAGINKGKVIEDLCVTDIAPLIARLLNIDFKAPDGKLVPGIIKGN